MSFVLLVTSKNLLNSNWENQDMAGKKHKNNLDWRQISRVLRIKENRNRNFAAELHWTKRNVDMGHKWNKKGKIIVELSYLKVPQVLDKNELIGDVVT